MRRAYQRVPQSRLATFAENVYNRMKGIAGYESFQAQIDAMEAPLAIYKQALLAAENEGKSEILAKNIAKQKMIRVLDKLATSMEINEDITAQWIVDAGFSLKPEHTPVYKGKLPPPQIISAGTTGRRGEIKIDLKNEYPRAIAMHALEYTANRGESWNNGKYYDKPRFIIDGLPSPGDILLRVKGLGKNGNESDWSEPVAVAVL